jgi:hypothetical protein
MARIGQHHGDHLFGHAIRVGAGGIHDIHALFTGMLDVNGVKTCAGTDHHLQVGEGIHDGCGDFFTADDERIGFRMELDQLFNGGLSVLDHGVTAMCLEKICCDGI